MQPQIVCLGEPMLEFNRQADGRYCAAHGPRGVRPGTAWRADRDPVVRRALAGVL